MLSVKNLTAIILLSIEYKITPIKNKAATGERKSFYDSQGNPLSLNGTLRDITEQKKEEQRKDDFMGMVSHELKTPLTSLKAYLQLLQRTKATRKIPDIKLCWKNL